MTQSRAGEQPKISQIGSTYAQDLADIHAESADTPFLHPMGRTLDAIFEDTTSLLARLAGPTLSVSLACNAQMLARASIFDRAIAKGFLASCANQREQDEAGRLGLPGSQVVLSGPAKFWPRGFPASKVRAVFCDSLDELGMLAGHIYRGESVAEYVGATLRLAENESSRLGIPISATDGIEDLCARFAALPAAQKIGLEFHADASTIGIDLWAHLAHRFLDLAALIGLWIGRPVSCLGIGGEWFSEDWTFALEGPIAQLTGRIAEALPGVSCVILDSGLAFSQPSHSLITRVLDVRKNPIMEVVVDASTVELPDTESFVHRLAWRSARDQTWRRVAPGRACVLGRLNREGDILARQVEIPEGLQVGDLLAFCDVPDSPEKYA